MPMQESEFWHVMAKIGGAAIAVVGGGFWWLVRKWVNDRFETVEKRMTDTEDEIDNLKSSSAGHDTRLGEIGTHIAYIRENSDDTNERLGTLDEKLDKLIARDRRS